MIERLGSEFVSRVYVDMNPRASVRSSDRKNAGNRCVIDPNGFPAHLSVLFE